MRRVARPQQLVVGALAFVLASLPQLLRGTEPAAGIDPGRLRSWDATVTWRARAGYKDNVLLSGFAPEGAPFVGGSAEGIFTKVWPAGSLFELFGSFEDREFLDLAEVDREQNGLALVQGTHAWSLEWRTGEAVEYTYLNQVIDVSATEAEVTRALIEGHLLTGRLWAGRQIGAGELQLTVEGRRQFYVETLDDSWELAPRLSYEARVGDRTLLTFDYSFAYDWYDEDPLRAADGAPLPGTNRETQRQDLGFTARTHFGKARQWRLTFRAGGRLNRDAGSGYYDYQRALGALRLRYRHGGWEFEGGLKGLHYQYEVQTAGADADTLRRRTELLAEFRAQRTLWKSLAVFVDYSYEQTLANRAGDDYDVNTVGGGMEWTF